MYKNTGFTTREDYLESLAAEYELDFETVEAIAEVLGPDGLILSLEEFTESWK